MPEGKRLGLRARAAWLAKRLALSAGALLVLLFGLDVVTRLVWPMPTPSLVRGSTYPVSLPLANGRSNLRWGQPPPETGQFLPAAKAPGELRVLTFGESSAEGCPWGQEASPAAFLEEELRSALPDRHVTVINLGKTSSFLMDSYYYLVGARVFEPDYVVFYQGSNDRYDLDAEMCAVVQHPLAHSIWRRLVETLHAAWLARVFGPEKYLSWTSGEEERRLVSKEPREPRCDEEEAFEAWTEILLDTASSMGARAIVVGFTTNDLNWFQERLNQSSSVSPVSRRLLTCPLQPDCRPGAIIREEEQRTQPPPAEPEGILAPALAESLVELAGGEERDDSESVLDNGWLRNRRTRNEAWRRTAARHDFLFVDFDALVLELPEAGARVPPVFVDAVHLSVAGYAILGEQMARAVIADLAAEPVPEEGFWRPAADLDAYFAEVSRRTSTVVAQCSMRLSHAERYFEAGQRLIAGFAFREASEVCPSEQLRPLRERYRRYVEEQLGR